VLGFDVVSHALDVRKRIAVVTQDHATEIFLTVRDNLLTFARFHGITGADARRRADRVIEQFDLKTEAHRKAMDLSGGFKRRVQVGKMLMVDTPMLFLDEFSTGMDPILKRSVMNLLRAERDKGRTIVLTTQILSEAEELCDDILIVNHGKQVARGGPAHAQAAVAGRLRSLDYLRRAAAERARAARGAASAPAGDQRDHRRRRAARA
jgi:ABC-2 type transport system ATP-binding protein